LKKYLFALLLCSQFAFPADQQAQPVAGLNSQNTSEQKEIDNQNQSSLENRKHLKYQTTLSIVGAEYSGYHNNLAIGAGYFIDDKNLINLRYTFQNSPGLTSNTSTNDYPETLRALTIGDRHFYGNSFNVMGSLYWKQHTKFDRSNSNTYLFKDFGVGARLGNEWQWQNFTMGCDWFGVNHSLVKIKNTFPGTSFGIDQDLTFGFLNFYLGYSF
jgi:hypothetical protein